MNNIYDIISLDKMMTAHKAFGMTIKQKAHEVESTWLKAIEPQIHEAIAKHSFTVNIRIPVYLVNSIVNLAGKLGYTVDIDPDDGNAATATSIWISWDEQNVKTE